MSSNPYETPQGGGSPFGNSAQQAQIESEISKQAIASLIVAIIGFFCFGIILGPFAIYRGNKALRLIQQYNVGQQHSGIATAGKIIGIVVTVLHVLAMVLYAVVICGGIAAQQ